MKHRHNRILILIFLLKTLFFYSTDLSSQVVRKELTAKRTDHPPKIDGILDEEAWLQAEQASQFNQWQPYNDRPGTYESHVKLIYDDNAIYIGANMIDPDPDSILTELGIRDADDRINADHFWIDINPFNDGVNGFTFKVSASGVQTDINRSAVGRRGPGRETGGLNWDAAWKSHSKIHDQGWSVEMEIPYSALRFPTKDVQEWGINFFREIRRYQETSTWNFIKRGVGTPLNYLGVVKGIKGIKPPLRLSFFPYLSGYLEKDVSDNTWRTSYNGGMDLKWGISEGFTLDVTLIPDFGQVQSDAKILNLSPFEVRYDENRQFFTEGMELFQRANLFYSRRVGGEPKGYEELEEQLTETEIIVSNPIETRMINATKLSGRTNKGLGIGLFNAMTLASHAEIKDTITTINRSVLTQPFTNYNILVLDQSLPNNSYVSIINTNTLMDQSYMANVTGSEFNILDKTNRYGVRGQLAASQLYYEDADNLFGYKYDIRAGKFGGIVQYDISSQIISDKYDQNDLGFMRRNNEIENQISLEYNIFDPFGRFLDFSTGISVEHNQLYYPRRFTGLRIDLDTRATFVNRFEIFMRAEYNPVGMKDYFEPRVDGRFYQIDRSFEFFSRMETDSRKMLAIQGDIRYQRIFSQFKQRDYGFEISPRLRLNDRFNITVGLEYFKRENDIGYVEDINEDSIYFGKRQSPTFISRVLANYIFSNNISLSFNMRHYWARVRYDGEYFFLNPDGTLREIENDLGIEDINYNAFTIDMVFKWNFAPASWITIVWKNIVDSEGNRIINNYFDNVDQMFKDNQVNSFSAKILYYLDYQYLRKAFRKK